MAAKTSRTADTGVDELFFRNDLVSLCLLVNRRHRTLRTIDFRAGPTASKRDFILSAAKREGIEKVFTLVERDEVATWMRLGFSREGSIPAFYRRSDAWIMGAVVDGIRPLRRDALGAIMEMDEDDLPGDAAPESPAARLVAKTIQKATSLCHDRGAPRLPSLKLEPAKDADARKAITAAARSGRALTGFEPFGRDLERETWAFSGRGGLSILAAWEVQPSFGSALVEVLMSPRTEAERAGIIAALEVLCEKLTAKGTASAFALSPAGDIPLASAFLAGGFRRSGVLASHLVVGGERKDAIMWSRKLGAAAEK
jgi:hypothetical protein